MEDKWVDRLSRKWAYIIGVSTIIILTTANQVLIQKILHDQQADATIINLAGKQRMLSQKIAKEAYQFEEEGFSLDHLKNEVGLWNRIHVGLQEGNEELGLPGEMSENVQPLFDQISPFQEAISSAILEADAKSDLADVLPVISENESVFLERMDEIVSVLEEESRAGIRKLIYLEIILATITVLILFLEFAFIFRPLFLQMRRNYLKLNDTLHQLADSKGDLFESIQRFDLSIQAINAGVWDWFILDGSEWWSPKFYELLGYKPGEIPATYDTFLNVLLHPDDKEAVVEAVQEHLEKKKPYKIEIRMKTKSGDYKWFESAGQAKWDEKGKPIRMVGSIIDIDTKKNALMMVENQTSELKRIIELLNETQKLAHIGSWEVDIKKMICYWSDEVYRIHEVEMGTPIAVEDGIKFYREDFRPIIQEAVDKGIEEQKSWDLECIIVTLGGDELWVRTVGLPVFENGELIGLRGLFMDIDKQKRAEEERQNTQLIFRSIFNNTFNFTGLLEPDGTLIEANKSALDFGGFTLDEARGLNFADAPWWSLSKEINDQLRSSIKKAAKGEFIRYDVDVVGKGGKVITIDFSISPIFNEKGKVIYLVPEGRDISERKELEEEIEKKTELLFEAQEIAKIGNWNWDMAEDKITWSDQMYEIFGQTRDFEPTFENLQQLMHPDDSAPFREDVERAIKNKGAHNFVHRIVLKEGAEVRYIHERGEVFYNEEGEPYRMAGTSQDVTIEKEHEQTILLERQQLKEIVEKAPIAAAIFDRDMNYIAASKRWYLDYAIKEKDITGMCHYDLFPEIREMPEWLQDHQDVLNGKELENHKDHFVRKDGSLQWLNWKLMPWYTEPDKIGGIIMYTADITEQVEYQQKIENLNEVLEKKVRHRTQELNRANKELEAFSYSISHDLRAPLRSINGFADILEEDYKDTLDEEGNRLLGIIKSSGVQMGNLIDGVLTFSRLGKKALEKNPIDMTRLSEEVSKEVIHDNQGDDIEIKIPELIDIEGDLVLMKQVLTNLLSNAVKYSSGKQKIIIELASKKKDDVIIYSIKDNGVGFDMKYHDKLFGVFQRLHRADEFDGTGVGLAIVKRIIAKHGGEVWAESKVNEGSVFFFSVPKNDQR